MRTNIVFTTLSECKRERRNINYYRSDDGRIFSGVQQQEPGAKFFLSSQDINKIVIIGSAETVMEGDEELFDSRLSDWAGRLDADNSVTISTLRLFIYRIADYVYQTEKDGIFKPGFDKGAETSGEPETYRMSSISHDITVRFIIDRVGTEDNYRDIIAALRGTPSNPSTLYMDMQGGQRTAVYINNAILQMLGEQSDVYNTELKQVLATDFMNRRPMNYIIDETGRYRIVDLVSGMNAFIKYGKADMLVEYLDRLKQSESPLFNEQVSRLTGAMKAVDDAIIFSRFNDEEDSQAGLSLVSALSHLKAAVREIETGDLEHSEVKNLFYILLDGIRDDLGDLLTGDGIDIPALIKWRLKKNDYFSAATILETYMPRYMVEHKVVYYAENAEDLAEAKRYFELYYLTEADAQKYKFKDINHYYIKDYRFRIEAQKLGTMKKMLGAGLDLPVKLYADRKRIKEVRNIVDMYFTVSKIRNDLAHQDSSGGRTPEDLKNCINKLLQDISSFAGLKNRYVLDNDTVIKLTEGKDARSEFRALLTDLISRETAVTSKYGRLNILLGEQHGELDELRRAKVVSAWATGFMMSSLGALGRDYDKLKNARATDLAAFLAQNEKTALIKLLLDKYNADNDTDYTTKEIKQLKLIAEAPATVTMQDAYRNMVSAWGRMNYEDARGEILKLVQSDEAWQECLEGMMERMLDSKSGNIADDEELAANRAVIRAIFEPLKASEDAWKELLLTAVSDEEGMVRLFEDYPLYYAVLTNEKRGK